MIKRITVYANEIILVLKRRKLIGVLREGRYWISAWSKTVRLSLFEPVSLDDTWTMYLENEFLMDQLSIIEIQDNEIGVEIKDGRLQRILSAGKYGYWNTPLDYDVVVIDLSNVESTSELPLGMLDSALLQPYVQGFKVESYELGMLYIDGVYQYDLGPGVYRFWKGKVITILGVDTRVQEMAIPGQEILTKDKAAVRLNFNAQYTVTDMHKALVDTKDYQVQLYSVMQMAIRAYVSGMTLDQLLANKESVGAHVIDGTTEAADLLGVEILSGGIKDVILPGDVRDIMNRVLIAQKQAQANTIMRHEETASTRSLLNTAKLMEDNAMLMKLKEMEYMEKIADKIGEITINGGGRVIDQLNDLMISK